MQTLGAGPGRLMDEETDNVGTATILWTGRSQTVHAPLGRRWRVAEAHIAKHGDTVTLQPKGNSWGEYFQSAEGASLPPSVQPPLERRKSVTGARCAP